MIGCFAEATSIDIKIDKEVCFLILLIFQELEDAQWFSKEDIKSVLTGKIREVSDQVKLSLPPSFAISNQLIRHWVNTTS